MIKYKTINQFSLESGYTEKAIRIKIDKGIWPDGVKVIAPDGRILISVEGYNEWVESTKIKENTKALASKAKLHSELVSSTRKANNNLRALTMIPTKRKVGS